EAEQAVDGRRVRRDRNRDAVVDALLQLHFEGNLLPSTDEIAARAGLSPRSLFRYFDDLDDLVQTAITRQLERVGHLFPIHASPSAPFEVRIAAVVVHRAELFEAIDPAARVTRLRAPFQGVVAAHLTKTRSSLRKQLSTLFAVELAQMEPSVASARLAAADVISSFDGWRLLRDDQRLSRARAELALSEALVALLQPAQP
ncbi:unnamed protein product, partial [Phaeothamnion confervicola]